MNTALAKEKPSANGFEAVFIVVAVLYFICYFLSLLFMSIDLLASSNKMMYLLAFAILPFSFFLIAALTFAKALATKDALSYKFFKCANLSSFILFLIIAAYLLCVKVLVLLPLLLSPLFGFALIALFSYGFWILLAIVPVIICSKAWKYLEE